MAVSVTPGQGTEQVLTLLNESKTNCCKTIDSSLKLHQPASLSTVMLRVAGSDQAKTSPLSKWLYPTTLAHLGASRLGALGGG